MRTLAAAVASCFLGLFCVSAGLAQSNTTTPWSELRAKNPAGLDLSLRLIAPHRYREGELIRAEVTIPVQDAAPGKPPVEEKWQFAGLLLDPAGDCGSQASPCWQSADLSFARTDPMLRLGETSGPLAVSLNNYLAALRPGNYRAAVLFRKEVLIGRGPMSARFGYADPPVFAASNAVEIEVVASTEAWEKQTIASSVAQLSGPAPNTPETYEQQRTAAEQLRFLDVPAAWSATLALLPVQENILLRGLEATREPGKVCELMQSAIPAASQAVSSYYLFGMGRLCARANLPAPPAYVPPPPGQKPPEPSAESVRYWRRYREYAQDATGKATSVLASSVARKQGESKAIALQTLIEQVQQTLANQPHQPLPAWLPAVKEEFAKSYSKLEGYRQRQLLGSYASTLRSADMIPLLESVLDTWKPGDYYEGPLEALQNLYRIDPARAQARIRAELLKARTWLDSPQLELLPASAARITDDDLIGAVAAAQSAGGWNVELRMTALAKYASSQALPRIKVLYESQQNSCQPELMAYFVRFDPEYADQVFHGHPWDMYLIPPPCALRYFERTPPIAMGPVLERYMAEYLMHSGVFLKKSVAKSLGQFGSPTAVGPLWHAFRYFHDYWRGRPEELAQNGEGADLEVELRNAIARGRHWLATDSDLRTIKSLCISEQCLYETQEDLRAWQKPLKIEFNGQPNEFRAQVAQYSGIESIEALEDKISRFPRGAQFVLTVYGAGLDDVVARFRKFASTHGVTIDSP